jgi:hypothetical protein
MRIVRLSLTGPPGWVASKADADLINDAIWAHSRRGAGIAHITTTALPTGIDVAIFLNPVDNAEHDIAAVLDSISKLLGTHSPPMRWRRYSDEGTKN